MFCCATGRLSALVAAAVVVVLSGCTSQTAPTVYSGGPDGQTVPAEATEAAGPRSSVNPEPLADSTVEVSPTAICPGDGPAPEPFTGPAVAEFGAGAVMDAYCEVGAFFAQRAVTSVTDPGMADPVRAGEDLRFVGERLSVTAAQEWGKTVALAGSSPAAARALSDLTYYRLAAPAGYAYPVGGPVSVDARVSAAAADVVRLSDGRKALALWFTASNTLPLAKTTGGRATHARTLTRKVAVYLVPNPDPVAAGDVSWLVESWTTSWRASKPVPWVPGR